MGFFSWLRRFFARAKTSTPASFQTLDRPLQLAIIARLDMDGRRALGLIRPLRVPEHIRQRMELMVAKFVAERERRSRHRKEQIVNAMRRSRYWEEQTANSLSMRWGRHIIDSNLGIILSHDKRVILVETFRV